MLQPRGFDGTNRARTCDLSRVKRTLFQLSYGPDHFGFYPPVRNGSSRVLNLEENTVFQTDAINSASLKIISDSSTFMDDSATVIGVPSAPKSINETIFSAREMIMDRTPIIISGPDTLMFIPETFIGEGPRTISGPEILISVTEILISGEPPDSGNQRVADLPRENTYLRSANTYFHYGDTYFRGPNDYRKGGEDHF